MMNSTLVNKLASLVTGCAVCALALAPTLAMAGGKGKGHSDHSAYSLSNSGNGGNGGGNPGGGNSPSMKFHASRTKSLSTGNANSSFDSSMFSKSLSTKGNKSFSQLNHGSLPLQSFNSTGGNTVNKWPGKFTKTDNGTFADSIKKHQFAPVEGIRIGEPNGPGNGNGNWPGKGNGKGKGKKKDCHNDCDFPWWPIIVGGCYNGGNCHHHHGCYDNYNGGCYNGGYYNNTVTYPSVTNIIIDGPAVAPAAAADATLVTGIDLELLDVRLVDPGDAAKNLGPRYRLTFGNRGTLPAGNFQVMLMASVDGTPQTGAPSATSEISGLASRQVFAADVRLPLAAELATMTKFIVVVDSAAQIGEPDENNNVAVLDSAKIATVDATSVAVQ
jgi:CARDB